MIESYFNCWIYKGRYQQIIPHRASADDLLSCLILLHIDGSTLFPDGSFKIERRLSNSDTSSFSEEIIQTFECLLPENWIFEIHHQFRLGNKYYLKINSCRKNSRWLTTLVTINTTSKTTLPSASPSF